MSHISKIDTKIKNLIFLKKALDALEMKYQIIEDCVFEIKTGSKYSIGIKEIDGNYELVADWWAIETFTGLKQDEIINKIHRQYAYETIKDKVKDLGYSIVQEDEDTKNNIHLTVRRWS